MGIQPKFIQYHSDIGKCQSTSVVVLGLGLELSSRTNLESLALALRVKSLALALRVSPWSWPSGPRPVGLAICQTYTATVVMT